MDNKNNPNANIDELLEEINARRFETVQNFKMDFSVDDIPDVVIEREPETTAAQDEEAPIRIEDEEEMPIRKPKVKKEKAPPTKLEGCLLKAIYGLLIVGVAGVLASLILVFVLDSMAFNRVQKVVDFEVPSGYATAEIADMLEEKDSSTTLSVSASTPKYPVLTGNGRLAPSHYRPIWAMPRWWKHCRL